MGDRDRTKLKSLCARCGINKWIVDFKEGCAANISSRSICLSCEQAEKIEVLEKAMREKDNEMRKMKDIISKLEKKIENLNKTEKRVDNVGSGEISTINISNAESSTESLKEKVEELSNIVKENRDTVVESGKEIVELRQDIAAMKSDREFQVVSGRRAARSVKSESWRGVTVTNRFAVLSQEETYLIGDSIVKEQTNNFANYNKSKRKVISFPGSKTKKVAEEVEKLEIQSTNSCIIVHAGSNDLYLKGNRVGNSEPLVKDLKNLVDKVAEKTNKGIVVGLLPRTYVNHFSLSKAIAINGRIEKYCKQKEVGFLDLWEVFVGKRQFFKRDGIHLSEIGQRKFGEILNRECERVMRLKQKGTKDIPEITMSSQAQGTDENENLEFSFEGFSQEN